jgi:hypothetical protein
MKKSLSTLASILALTIALCPMLTEAAGSIHQVSLEVVGSSTAAPNGSSAISFKTVAFNALCPGNPYYVYDPTCPDGTQPTKVYTGVEGEKTYITVSGSGNTLGGTSTDAYGSYVVVAANGTATFSLVSTVAETKTITVFASPGSSYNASASAVFANATPTPKPATPKPTPAPAPTPEPSPPAVPAASSYEVGGKAVADPSHIALQASDPLTLNGKTVAGGVVTLYIFSTPREATVTADAQGSWSYTVKGLEPGSHHVEATVTDPLTKKISERQTIASFTVAAVQKAPITVASKTAKSNNLPWIISGCVVVLTLGAAAMWWYRNRKKHAAQVAPPVDPLNPAL